VRRKSVCEWPTLALIAFCSFGWLSVMAWAEPLGPWIAFPIAALLITLHSSLQHEVLHGHPTRYAGLNEALIYFPLGLFIPFRRFKALHLRHHNNDLLTDPYDDPESFYLAWADWHRLPMPIRWVLVANNTLIGRLIIGPAVSLIGFYGSEMRLLVRGDRQAWTGWMHHLLGLLPVAVFVTQVAGVPLWLYAACVAYPGMSVLMLRTFAEHRAHENPEARSILVEFCPLFSLLFLNNNLHVVHHSYPQVAWYDLPSIYKARRAEWQSRNGGYVFKSYFHLIKDYLFRVKEPVVHPLSGHKTHEGQGVS